MPDLYALARVRRELRVELLDLGIHGTEDLDEAADRILLAADELTSNALRHATPPTSVGLHALPGAVLLTVTDAGPSSPPTPDPGRDPALGGLGLRIITTWATTHGWWPQQHTKTVWAVIPSS